MSSPKRGLRCYRCVGSGKSSLVFGRSRRVQAVDNET